MCGPFAIETLSFALMTGPYTPVKLDEGDKPGA